MSYANVGKVWSTETFRQYLSTISRPSWVKSITIHHTAAPSLAQRPAGFTAQHISNIRDYYSRTLGWNRGPHLFTDEDQIWGMTPLHVKGIHAVSFNSTSIGIEMLGNYDVEDPQSGRGLSVLKTTADCAVALLDWLDLPANASTVKFHRDDPKTSKTCPGNKISKGMFLSLLEPSSVPVATLPPLPVAVTAPVVDYAVNHKGYTYSEAVKMLRVARGLYYFGNDWLEGARYDKPSATTVAPLSELELIAPKQ